MLWDLIERMVGRRELHKVGSEFLNSLEFREVLLDFVEVIRGVFL